LERVPWCPEPARGRVPHGATADAPGKTTIIEGGDHHAVAATGVMQGIGESEAGAPPRQRRLQVRPVFNAETGGREELIEEVLEASTARSKQA
jgi:hypothetical protein